MSGGCSSPSTGSSRCRRRRGPPSRSPGSSANAPLAYLLSALAGVVYILATIGLAGTRPWARPLAWGAVVFELTGVLVVGTLTVLDAGDFPDDTVWSFYGRGYGFVPLVLPLVGLWWLHRTRAR